MRLQAPVDENGVGPGNTITLLGITVSGDGKTKYEGVNNLSSDELAFFSSVSDGDLVKARWKPFTSPTDPVDELSLE